MQKKTDRRVRKTKSQLKTGLAQLMREKSIREITVKELVDAVDINRSTFYLHYSDIPGLLAEVENEMMEEMQRAIREHPIDPGKDTVYYFIQDLFHVLDENRQIASALVGPHGDIGFVHKLEQLLEEKSRESLAALVPEKTGEMKYFYSYCLNGCLGFVKTWLETGEKETPEYAAEMAYRMVVSSVTAFYETKEGRDITGKYGGAAFVLIYLLFLVLLGLPIMVMEFAVGRGSQASIALSFDRLEPLGTKWHWYKWFGIGGNYLLMMFYTTIGGWLLLYTGKMAIGEFKGLDADGVTGVFTSLLGQPVTMTICMILVVVLCFGIVCMGLQKGVEQITKKMMILLFVLMIILAVRSVTLPGAEKGLEFYLLPDFKKAAEAGLKEVIFAAMGQAFFTLSLGIGAIAIFGSYIGKERTLTGEAVCVTVLDTLVALIAGFIIFPACFAFNVQPDSGPSLIFITLPNIFNAMSAGRIWGTIFFLCMFFAACSTIIAVFENLIAFVMDLTNCSRTKAVVGNLIAIIVLSLPCIFGFNIWSGFMPLGAGSSIQDLEDFIVSNNLLPIGSLIYLLFCTSRYGWGWDKFQKEANAGSGIKFPGWARFYVSYILPLIVLFIFVQGYWSKFVG